VQYLKAISDLFGLQQRTEALGHKANQVFVKHKGHRAKSKEFSNLSVQRRVGILQRRQQRECDNGRLFRGSFRSLKDREEEALEVAAVSREVTRTVP
jgi:hypothetical protein